MGKGAKGKSGLRLEALNEGVKAKVATIKRGLSGSKGLTVWDKGRLVYGDCD